MRRVVWEQDDDFVNSDPFDGTFWGAGGLGNVWDTIDPGNIPSFCFKVEETDQDNLIRIMDPSANVCKIRCLWWSPFRSVQRLLD